jgi:hypothetical protein
LRPRERNQVVFVITPPSVAQVNQNILLSKPDTIGFLCYGISLSSLRVIFFAKRFMPASI